MDERSNHLGLEQLADYADRRLQPSAASHVGEHLASCRRCQTELDSLLAIKAALAADTWQTPPLVARARARRVYRESRGMPARQSPLSRVAEWRLLWQQGWGAFVGSRPGTAFRPALVVAVAVLIFVISFVSLRQWQATGPPEVAVASLVQGDVQVKPADTAQWQPIHTPEGEAATRPVSFQPGDVLRTGDNSSLTLTFFENSSTYLDEAGEITLREMQGDGRDYAVTLVQAQGRIEVSVVPEPGQAIDFRVETPSAVVEVAGTQFEVFVSADGTTEVAVHEGAVVVSGATVSTRLTGGERLIVSPGLPPVTPAPALPTAEPSITPTSTPPFPAPETLEAPETAPEERASPTARPDPRDNRPTRKPLPTQVPPLPTKKPLPTQVPPPAQGLPPGQEIRPTPRELPTQAAVPPSLPVPTQASVPTRAGPPGRPRVASPAQGEGNPTRLPRRLRSALP